MGKKGHLSTLKKSTSYIGKRGGKELKEWLSYIPNNISLKPVHYTEQHI